MNCKNCGCENKIGSKFCYHCGSKLESIIHCPHCGKEILNKDKYCFYCGERKYFHKPSVYYTLSLYIELILICVMVISASYFSTTIIKPNNYTIIERFYDWFENYSHEVLVLFEVSIIFLIVLSIICLFLKHYPLIFKRVLYIISIIITLLFTFSFSFLIYNLLNETDGIIFMCLGTCITTIELVRFISCVYKDSKKKL